MSVVLISFVLISALNWLGRATAGVTVMAIAIWLLLRLCRVRSPEIQRFAWLLVLLPGVVVWRMSVVLPVLPAEEFAVVELRLEDEDVRSMSGAGGGGASLREQAFIEATDETSFAATSHHTGGFWVGFVLVGGWVVGMIVLAARWGWSYVAFARGLPQPLRAAEGWVSELREVCEELGLSRPIPLHVTERLGPALCLAGGGYRLLVPQVAWGRFSSQQRRSILRHELAHYVRGDLWKSLVARLLAWPQWFNPLAWLAVRRFEEAAECACDDAAIAAEREDTFDYLRALVELGTADYSTPTLQAAVHGGSLQCRVRRLLSPTGKDSVMKKLVVIAAALALAAGGFARIRLASGQSPAAAKENLAENSESDRVASAAPAKPKAEKLSQEAYLDLIRIFKEAVGFNQEMSAIKDRIKEVDLEVKEQQTKLNALRDELKATTESGRRSQLEKELADGTAKLAAEVAETKKQFLEAEAQVYNDVYEQVRVAVAEYAKEHGIRRVTRSQLIAFTDEKVDATDRKAVLQRVNRPILYLDGVSESSSDITDAILERLNGVKTR
jgi:beta-lactamase regulating signal transducer with metallopeptidase domain/Skp family chaperone for outer membrane proteins